MLEYIAISAVAQPQSPLKNKRTVFTVLFYILQKPILPLPLGEVADRRSDGEGKTATVPVVALRREL